VVANTRRGALLAAGSAALLAGCGAKKDAGADRADLLARQLQAAQVSAAAYTGLRGAPLDRLHARARARVRRLEAALRAAGGQPRPEPDAARSSSVALALSAASAELRAHVAATGRTADRAVRSLLAGLVVDAAQDEALLMLELGRDPLATPFPGQAL
jgi:hypothetical protein